MCDCVLMNESPRQSFAIWPPRDSPVSVTTWLHEIRALAQCIAAPPPFPADAARGQGEPVIVVPGFCSPDMATARLREFLTRQGFAPRTWDSGTNLGPTRTALSIFERQLMETAEACGRRVSLVGISLGGTIAREIAKRRPDCVARVVTLVSPIRLPVATCLAPLAQIAALVWDDTSREAMARILEPPPVPLTAIVSPKDGVVDWRACVPDDAPNVEMVLVPGAHMTIASNPAAQRIVAARLALHPPSP
jgi:pimeloyl-ACP methyl ester carboxylesterase